MPGETAFATRYAITAAAVSRVICETAGRIRAGTSDQETGNEGQIDQIHSPLRDLDLDRPRRQFINPVSRMVVLVPKNGKAQVPGLIESNSQGYDPERRLILQP
jgi:hypothetical protein